MTFDDFSAIFKHSSEFPPEARDRVPADLWNAIDEGNEAFFENFAGNQPQAYKVLTQECGRIHLLEVVSRGLGLGQRNKEHKNYHWGLMCEGRLVICNIPVSAASVREARPHLECLPKELRCYYGKMDGMSVPKGPGHGIVDYDLPSNPAGWREIDYYRKMNNMKKTTLNKINRDFGDHDLRIIVYGAKGDLVLLDFARKDKKPYHVKDNNFDDCALIENAPEALDRCFANAIRGFPEPFDFRRS
ncbi:MAG: hypothetical protein A2X56_06210 [Nitrospirae bacterium GWC2_57_13]|nr:MAG: hypothetical protein A2072_02445 [Nitrospirae bacterium GWC1_57_7]OGW29681.1 MAG: hypothetical protein A2X56_06210 [Nitrospirae bacterium GWC2_57_13]HAR44848.1 hypothetical protein [Nitrospiraceae bacterium]HAS53084.1 hypothetical protein [Nitrospiraceae bacterium]